MEYVYGTMPQFGRLGHYATLRLNSIPILYKGKEGKGKGSGFI